MANSSALHTGNIIESASALFGSGVSKPARQQAEPTGEKHQLAMTRRLEQLQAALGETATVPAQTAARNIAPPAARHGVGTGSLFVTSLLSALVGAGLMWLATQQEPAPGEPAAVVHSIAAPTPAAEPSPVAIAPNPEIADEKQLGERLENWRSAWAQRDIAGYLNAYSQQFSPADGSSRNAWVSARTKKLGAGVPIDIRINNLVIERIDAEQFKVNFLQDYASGSYRETARAKTLLFVREGGEWKIRQERLE